MIWQAEAESKQQMKDATESRLRFDQKFTCTLNFHLVYAFDFKRAAQRIEANLVNTS